MLSGGSWAARLASLPAWKAVQVGGLALLAPSPFLFACACTCGPGSPIPAVPEAPWPPLLVVGGVAAALILRRRRTGTGRPQQVRRMRRVVMATARIFVLVFMLSVATALAGAVVMAATASATPSPVPCDCSPGTTPSGVAGASVTVPDAGAGITALRFAVPLVAGGAAVAGGAWLVRPRRRSS